MRPSAGAGRRYSEFRVGQTFGGTVTVTDEHLQRGAELIGDFNPLHVDDEFARRSPFGGRILHGVLTSALMSAPFGNLVAGTALGYLEHNARFLAPVRPGDRLEIEWRVTELIDKPHRRGGVVVAECAATNQQGIVVASASGRMLVADAQAAAPP
ncbi:MAG TPA: MaoC family dehydratase [Burkholderiaceae bacterium]|nr:MaoC family dehydratase [Burkholderiaceae bacterium]